MFLALRIGLVIGLVTLYPSFAEESLPRESTPCKGTTALSQALACIQTNEPAFKTALQGEREASELESSAYRLINPEFDLEYLNGNSFGETQREVTAALLFTIELGGKRSARARAFRSEGLLLRAEAFEQRLAALTEIGGAALRLHQLSREKSILEESLATFRKVIRLYQSRSQLPPEQRVGLHAFELITLDYERRILENEAELIQAQNRTLPLFGMESRGVPLDIDQTTVNPSSLQAKIDSWIEESPEMLRLRSRQGKAEGDVALARSEMWPDHRIGPAFRRVTTGPLSYSAAGISLTFPIPVLTQNSALRASRETTEKRVASQVQWDERDIRAQYTAILEQIGKISKSLRSTQSEKEIQEKHRVTESYFERGLVGGALLIETHRALVDYYSTKHSLERRLLADTLKIKMLTEAGSAR
jgi:outer membrane protein TolC